MSFFNNVKIRTKILGGFLIVVLILIMISCLGIFMTLKINNTYSKAITEESQNINVIEEAVVEFANMMRLSREILVYEDDPVKLEESYANYQKTYGELINSINEYIEISGETANSLTQEKTLENVEKYNTSVNKIYALIKEGKRQEALDILNVEEIDVATEIVATINAVHDKSREQMESISKDNTNFTYVTIAILSVSSVVAVMASLILGAIISNSITKPVKKLVDASNDIANGKLDISLSSNGKDEISQLSNSFDIVAETLKSLMYDIENLSFKVQQEGEIDARIDVDKFKGSYKDVSAGINTIVDGLVADILECLKCSQAYAEGNFEVAPKKLQGKKVVITEAFDTLKSNLNSVVLDVKKLVESAANGNLSTRMDASKYNNSWADLAIGLNNILEGVIAPVNETIHVVEEMAKGNLSVQIVSDYKGDYAKLKDSMNNTLNTVSNYVEEISETLDQMSNENFTVEISTDYIGDFAPIKTSLNKIIDTFNDILHEINISAEQISSGTRQISESSMSLAVGASEQTNSVNQLVNTLDTITEQTRKNAQDAKKANELAYDTKDNAAVGSSEMKKMLESMSEINEASSNISKIIKVIDDIAFQTNLLALNAAVEAARAGQHGKGFAVVAEEVRSLAARSKNAAQETTILIQGSVAKVNDGTKIANQTSETLQAIVTQITDISELVGGVADASSQQEKSISAINVGINEISQVTQTNTATSEEQASSSQELSSQAELFRNMVSKFKLKNRNSGFKDTKKIQQKSKQQNANQKINDALNYIGNANNNRNSYKESLSNDINTDRNFEDAFDTSGEYLKDDFGKYV